MAIKNSKVLRIWSRNCAIPQANSKVKTYSVGPDFQNYSPTVWPEAIGVKTSSIIEGENFCLDLTKKKRNFQCTSKLIHVSVHMDLTILKQFKES
jgi:hypothetical protein